MNIFVVNSDPTVAARQLCDKHVVKMVLESAQMLCVVAHVECGKRQTDYTNEDIPYRLVHLKHPCTIWAYTCRENAQWLLEHFRGLLDEYTRRYNRHHACEHVWRWLQTHDWMPDESLGACTPFAQAMPPEYKVEGDAVSAYQQYYLGEKRYFAKWAKDPDSMPAWWRAAVRRREMCSPSPEA